MKQVSPELLEHLHTGKEFHMVDLYEIALRSGLVFRYANYDRDIKLPDGRVFSHKGPLFKRNRIKLSSGISVDKMTVTVHTDDSDTIDGTPMMQIAHNGGFDEAQLSLNRCFLRELPEREIVKSESSFTRASTAYKKDGSEVASGKPRYETLYGDQVLVEETTNLITKQNMEETPWIKGPSTTIEYGIISDNKTWNRFSVPATGGTFAQFPINVLSGKPYTLSMLCKNPSSAAQIIQIGFAVAAGSGASIGIKNYTIQANTIIRVETTITASATATYYAAVDNPANSYVVDVLLSEIQLEQKDHATPFAIGYRPEQRNELPFGEGIMVEEGTTNLIPVNKQKFVGWSPVSGAIVTLTQNQVVPEWGAIDATRIQISGGTSQHKYGSDVTINVSDGQNYTESVWVKNIGANPVTITNGITIVGIPIIYSGEVKKLVFTNSAAGTFTLRFATVAGRTTDSLDFIAWRPKIEAKAYSTSFHTTTRQPEVVTIKHGLTPEQGTIEGIFEVNDLSKRQVSGHYPRVFGIPIVGNNDRGIGFRHSPASANWWFQIGDANGSDTVNISDSLTPNGFYRYRVTWSASLATIDLYSLSTKQRVATASIVNPKLPSAFVENMNIGGTGSRATAFANTIHADIRCSSIVRTDTEYGLDAPLPVDEWTTAKASFFNDLTVQRMVLHDALERSKLQVVGAVEMFTGYIDVDGGGGLEMKWVVKSGAQKLNVEYPLRKYYPTCPYSLYGPGCGLNINSYTTTGTITEATSHQEFKTNVSKQNGYYDQGGIEFTSGVLAGVSAPIQTSYQANGRIILLLPMDAMPSAGDTFKIYPGCNKTPITCKNKFNNFNKNRATPYIPLKETII